MTKNLVCMQSNTIDEFYIILIDEYNRLILSENFRQSLLGGTFKIYMKGEMVEVCQVQKLLDDIVPIKLLYSYDEFFILLNTGFLLYIYTEFEGMCLSYNTYNKYCTTVPDIADIEILNYTVSLILMDNSILFFRMNTPTHQHPNPQITINIEYRNVKLFNKSILFMIDEFHFILYNASDCSKMDIYVEKPVLNFYITNYYIIYVFCDLTIQIVKNSNNSRNFKINFNIVDDTELDMYIIVTLELDEITYPGETYEQIYQILKTGEIKPNFDGFDDDNRDLWFTLYNTKHIKTIETLNEQKTLELLNFINSIDFLYILCYDNGMICVLSNGSFKLFGCNKHCMLITAISKSDIFIEPLDTYKVLSNLPASYI